jgi:PAS domain S-box-containing protein
MMGWANYAGTFLRSKLGRRLLMVLLGTLAVGSLAFLLILVSVYRASLIHEHTRASTQVNQLLQASLENAMLKRDIPGLQEIVKNLGNQEDIAGVRILNPGGIIRFSTAADQIGKSFAAVNGDGGGEFLKPSSAFLDVPGQGEVLRTINPVLNKPACSVCHGALAAHPINGILVVDYHAGNIRADAWASAAILAGAGILVGFAAMTSVSLFLYRFVLRPVEQLAEASAQFAAGNLSSRAMITGHDDLAVMGKRFNDMADQVGHSITRLRASELFLQSVIDSIPDGIRVIGESYKILMVNLAYCQQLGITPEQAIGRPCHESSHHLKEPCSSTLATCPMVELCGAHASLKCQHRHLRSDGTELFVEVSAARIKLMLSGEEQYCIVESIRDLAEQARLSHERRLSEIGQLATGIAHEIYNPLSSIQLALRALRDEVSHAALSVDAENYLKTVDDEIEKCIVMTNRLLRVSEPSESDRSVMSVKDIVADVLALVKYQLDEAKVVATITAEGDPRILAIASDVGIVSLNIVQNAIHAMPRGGRLAVSISRADAFVKVDFADEGVGIPQEDLQKIFWPFWSKRADGSHGTGLGLSICRGIIERIGGAVSVSSVLHEGTVFTIMLPSAEFEANQ